MRVPRCAIIWYMGLPQCKSLICLICLDLWVVYLADVAQACPGWWRRQWGNLKTICHASSLSLPALEKTLPQHGCSRHASHLRSTSGLLLLLYVSNYKNLPWATLWLCMELVNKREKELVCLDNQVSLDSFFDFLICLMEKNHLMRIHCQVLVRNSHCGRTYSHQVWALD